MLSYDTLDAIADSVNPALGVTALIVPWVRRKSARYALALDLLTLLAVGLAYLLAGIDAQLGLWPRVGVDFSTHTAVFVAIASSLWQHGRTWRMAVATLGLAYAGLMLFQRYHSWLDIASTAVVAVILLTLLWWRATRLLHSKALA